MANSCRALGLAWAACLAVDGGACAPQSPDPGPVALVRFVAEPIEIDGDLAEWPAEPTLRFDRQEQVESHKIDKPWGGPGDLSAEFHLAYDTIHLYLAGRVRDDSLVPGQVGRAWYHGDAIELFIDVREPATAEAAQRFDENVVQLFLMPFSQDRLWGRVDWGVDPPIPSGAGWSGVRVAFRRLAPDLFAFEASVPFHNFPAIAGRSEIGFNLAIDDHDEGKDRYQYMTWNGLNPVERKRRLARMRFLGPAPLSKVPADSGDLLAWLIGVGGGIAVPLGGVLWIALLMWAWGRLGRSAPRLRVVGRVIGVVLFGLGLVLPTWLSSTRRAAAEASAVRIADRLVERVLQLENGLLANYRGGARDRMLTELLSGRAITREQKYEHSFGAEVDQAGQLGAQARSLPVLGLAVRPYGVPLRRDRPEVFDFRTAVLPGKLHAIVVRSMFPVARVSAEPNVRLQLTLTRSAEQVEPVTEIREIRLPFVPADLPGFEQSEVSVVTFPIDRATQTLSLACLDDDQLALLGLTWVADDGRIVRPLFLGEDSVTGVPMDLRGPWPQNAGLELLPNRRVVLPVAVERAAGFDKLWLFYRASYRGRPLDVRVGDRVCEVTLRFADERAPPSTVTFDHQTSMFFEEDQFNQGAPTDHAVRVASRWTGRDQVVRVNLMREIDLPEDATLAAIEFENKGAYAIRFRSMVFGRRVPAEPLAAPDGPLVARAGEPDREGFRPEVLAELAGAEFGVFRNGRLSSATFGEFDTPTRTDLPAAAQGPRLLTGSFARRVDDGDTSVHELYRALPGQGWSGAVVGVFVEDRDFGNHVRWLHRIGALLCALTLPVLLSLFGDSLAFMNNLRVRLMAVLTVATLVPLLFLSIVLVRVLEAGHETDLQTDMQRTLATVGRQLEAREHELVASARSWLQDLLQVLVRAETAGADGDPAALEARLAPLVQSQVPPAWKVDGGYLRFEFVPTGGSPVGRPFSVFAGGDELASLDIPLRTEPGAYLAWGVPLIGVRAEVDVPELGKCSLSVARRMDEDFLATIVPGKAVVLCDMNGYPLCMAGSGPLRRDELERNTVDARLIGAHDRIAREVVEIGQGVVRRHPTGSGGWIGAYDVLRDVQETPRLLLGVVGPDQVATLPLAMGRVPVRAFFLGVAGLLVLLSMFLSFVVTARISRPIDRLEHGAQALRRGDLDVHIVPEEGGQIGRLTRTFNQMARDLRARIQDLRTLNRGFQDLSAKLELDETLAGAVGFYSSQGSADQVRILLVDRDRDRIAIHGGSGGLIERDRPGVQVLLEATGPLSMRLGSELPLGPKFAAFRSVVALPLLLAGSNRGAVLLLFESSRPGQLELDLLWTMTAQTSAAIENARLYRHAVEDLYTGAFRPEYFKRRVVEVIERAHLDGRSVALIGLQLTDGKEIAEALGKEGHGRLLEQLIGEIRDQLGAHASVCRIGDDELQVLHDDAAPELAERVASELIERFGRHHAALPAGMGSLRIEAGHATFPRDAASAEFLFDALATRLGPVPAAEPARDRPRRRWRDGALPVSPIMERLADTLERVAATDMTILLEGETGTGKEVLANHIHAWSKRASGPLVKVHCAALPEGLLQSELFGHEMGAFTGAVDRRIGRFEQASGGTIFLDEIGEVSLDVQVKLLRVLQEREIDRVGGIEPIPVDVRVIAATNRDVRRMVADGRFREDLFYRLQGMLIHVPPLRERKVEIPGLIEHFRREAVAAGHTAVTGFTTEAVDHLFRAEWPGNIRELRNTVFRAMVMAPGPLVTQADLLGLPPPAPVERAESGVNSVAGAGPDRAGPEAPAGIGLRGSSLLEFVRRNPDASNEECGRALGVSARTALRELSVLIRLGLVVRRGSRRGARYSVSSMRPDDPTGR